MKKKKRINLLQNRYDYYALERIFVWLKRGVIIYSMLFVIGAFASTALFIYKTKNSDELTRQKNLLLLGSNLQKTDEAKLLILSKKLNYFKQYSQDDAQFIPYYNLLLGALKTSSQSGTLIEFNINKKHDVHFTLHFNSFPEMTQSFAFIESEQFLKNFHSLQMSNFLGLTADKNKYELTFSGSFKNVDQIKN